MATLELLRDTLELLDRLEANLLAIEEPGERRLLGHARDIRWKLKRDLGLMEAMHLAEYFPALGLEWVEPEERV